MDQSGTCVKEVQVNANSIYLDFFHPSFIVGKGRVHEHSTKSHYGGSGGFINKKSRYVIKSFQYTLKSPFLEIRIIFFLTDYEKPSCRCFFISKSAAARKG